MKNKTPQSRKVTAIRTGTTTPPARRRMSRDDWKLCRDCMHNYDVTRENTFEILQKQQHHPTVRKALLNCARTLHRATNRMPNDADDYVFKITGLMGAMEMLGRA